MYYQFVFLCISAHIPLFLYPFLHTVSKTRPFEYLRLTSLGVIGALVKVISLLKIRVDAGIKTAQCKPPNGQTIVHQS